VPGDDVSSKIFGEIYKSEHWEGGSGQGSRANATEAYRWVLETVLGARDVRTVVDAGCGDWEFAQLIDWSPVSYVGVDVVPDVIEHNTATFGRPNVSFECTDMSRSVLPQADVLLCKDVLQHWPIEWIADFLLRVRGRYRYVLLTNDITSVRCPPEHLNSQIPVGAWRTLDLERPEFGQSAAWRLDYDVGGEWTKRILLLVKRRYRLRARATPNSALRRLRSL